MALAAGAVAAGAAFAHGEGGIEADKSPQTATSFDIVHAKVATRGLTATFHMGVAAQAGTSTPGQSGKLAGSDVYSYVWPTTIDPYDVGFEKGAGILALAVTAHPDFDDTPLYDENGDGKTGDDGGLWHSHWVVLAPTEACGPGALAVVDIPEGAKPRLPKTWPGLPILIDSPGWDPLIADDTVEVNVPFDDIAAVEAASFDGVTAGLRVNQNVHAPLLCVVDVFDVASGNLTLPGKVNR
ncbi:MAG: hypothetical protein RH942_17785 [Kiloniellaceae bacterium]